MNKRYVNGALVILLVVIWSSVVYKFFIKPKKQLTSNQNNNIYNNYSANYKISKDTFNLVLINNDPFKVSKKRPLYKKSLKPVSRQVVQKTTNNTNVNFPTITYHGFIKGENKATRLILLKINNRLYRKREEEQVNNVTVVKAYNDSLIVSFQNNLKTIKKVND